MKRNLYLQRDYFDSPYGVLSIGCEHDNLCSIQLLDVKPDTLDAQHSLAKQAFDQVLEYAAGKRREFDLPYRLYGTSFQCLVWEALRSIPYGQCICYQDLAARVGRPRACRAVGSACAANPLLILLPCHRVVASGGRLGGYAAGLELKRSLLRLEGSILL